MSFTHPESLTASAARARAALAELLEQVDHCNPDDVVATLAEVEAVGRLADAVRVRAAVPLAESATLAEQFGFTSATDAVATVARISTRAARVRVRVATAVHTSLSLTGVALEPERPAIAAALGSGQLGLEAAELIVRELDGTSRRTEKWQQDEAEQVMVAISCGIEPATVASMPPVSVDYLTGAVRQVASLIDPDGARPREERAKSRRIFHLGKVNEDGLLPGRGLFTPEFGQLLEAAVEAKRRTPRFLDEGRAGSSEGIDGAVEDSTLGDPTLGGSTLGSLDGDAPFDFAPFDDRTRGQRMHDVLVALVTAGTQTEGSPRINGSPVTVVVTVNADDLDLDGTNPESLNGALDSDPIGTMAGSSVPVSRAEVLRYMDSAGYRIVTLHKGRIVDISSQQRCFTSLQRVAVAARDGYRCFVPGCTAPHYALQMHHVRAFRDGGPTHTDNAILLCWWHHRIVDKGPWEYRMVDGVPEVRGPGIYEWTRRTPARAMELAA